MSERIVVEATGQARIEGTPDLPGWGDDLSRLTWHDLDPLWSPYLARLRAELLDPRRLVLIASCSC
jgi:hypothetical protein